MIMKPHFNAFVIVASDDDIQQLSDSVLVAFGPDGCPCSHEAYRVPALVRAASMKEVQEDHALHMVVLDARAEVPMDTLDLLFNAKVIVVRVGKPADWKKEVLGERRVFSVLHGGELADFSFAVKEHLGLPAWECD